MTASAIWNAKVVTDTSGASVSLSSATSAFTLMPNEPLLISPPLDFWKLSNLPDRVGGVRAARRLSHWRTSKRLPLPHEP